MKTLSFDWATKKALTVYNPGTGKTKQVQNTIPAFEKLLATLKDPAALLFEFGGGDTFKIMAFRAGHFVLQIPGKKIKDYRDKRGIEKSDPSDAKLIYDFYVENGGEAAKGILRNSILGVRLPSSNKKGAAAIGKVRNSFKPRLCRPSSKNKGGSAKVVLRNSAGRVPSPFYLFKESNAKIAEIKILFRTHEDLKKSMVREKNRLFAFNLQFRIAQVADDRINKIQAQKEASIAAKQKELETLKEILKKKLEAFEIWTYYKRTKGIGPIIMAGLIGELGGRQFEDNGGLKHYAGMVARADHKNFNRYVKMILFHFAELVIKTRTPKWRPLYDSMKIYYAKKHKDWRPGKIHAYAMKFIETKFLIEFWHKWRGEK